MKTQSIPTMRGIEFESVRAWHARSVKNCQCRACRAELAAERAAHAAAVQSVLDSISLEPIGKVGAR